MRVEGMGKPPNGKLIRLSAELEGNRIKTLSIRGDFFASPEEGFDRVEERLRGVALGDAASAFDRFLAEEGVEAQGIDGEALGRILCEAARRGGDGGE